MTLVAAPSPHSLTVHVQASHAFFLSENIIFIIFTSLIVILAFTLREMRSKRKLNNNRKIIKYFHTVSV